MTRLARPRLVWLMSATLAKKSSSRDGDHLASRSPPTGGAPSFSSPLALSLSLPLSLSLFLLFGEDDVRSRDRQRTRRQRLGAAFAPAEPVSGSTIVLGLRGRPRSRFIVAARQSHLRRASIRLALGHPANALDELRRAATESASAYLSVLTPLASPGGGVRRREQTGVCVCKRSYWISSRGTATRIRRMLARQAFQYSWSDININIINVSIY